MFIKLKKYFYNLTHPRILNINYDINFWGLDIYEGDFEK